VPDLEPSESTQESPNDNYQFRRDMLLVVNSLNTAVNHLKTLMQLLTDDDNELCGEYYKTARENGLTL
ncbi:hypothetical protein, partial [Paramagnetospirillum caucaseum]|uniref:hypothetical protein n=1 Tax=Paramagnetospirillum caucaseum TaxID=1244869 RepID=UPI001F3BBD8C